MDPQATLIGTATLRIHLDEAARAGARAVATDTKAHNTAALGALRRNGATLIARQDTAEIRAALMPKEMLTPSPTVNPFSPGLLTTGGTAAPAHHPSRAGL